MFSSKSIRNLVAALLIVLATVPLWTAGQADAKAIESWNRIHLQATSQEQVYKSNRKFPDTAPLYFGIYLNGHEIKRGGFVGKCRYVYFSHRIQAEMRLCGTSPHVELFYTGHARFTFIWAIGPGIS